MVWALINIQCPLYRVRAVFCKKGVLRNFATFTGKHLCVPKAEGLFRTPTDNCFQSY